MFGRKICCYPEKSWLKSMHAIECCLFLPLFAGFISCNRGVNDGGKKKKACASEYLRRGLCTVKQWSCTKSSCAQISKEENTSVRRVSSKSESSLYIKRKRIETPGYSVTIISTFLATSTFSHSKIFART